MVDGMRERTALGIADKLDYWTRSVMSIHNVPTLPKLCDCGEKAADMLRQQRAEIERLARKNAAYASLDSKHTPGPWTVPYKEFSKVKAENGAVIATCHKLTNLTNLEANARLLAAAPDLLEVCRRLAAVNVFSADNDVAQIIMMARDAVEKATGEKA